MYLNDEFKTNIQTLTTATEIDSHLTTKIDSLDDTNNMTHILIYAIPISCLAIVAVLLLALGIYRRHGFLEKWNSLTRMKNTNPRFHERAGLRRDSEYEVHSDSFNSIATVDERKQTPKESDFRPTTIT